MMNLYKFHNCLLNKHDEYADEIELFNNHGCTPGYGINSNPDIKTIPGDSILHIIKKLPQEAYSYAHRVLNSRWLEAEPYILQNPHVAYWYTIDVIKKRWPEAEPIIKNTFWWDTYRRRFKIGKFD